MLQAIAPSLFDITYSARPSVATPEVALVATVEIAARAAHDSAGGSPTPVADRAAHARAERGPARGRADRPRAAAKVSSRRPAIEGVSAGSAGSDGRALPASDQPADGCAARDHGRCA